MYKFFVLILSCFNIRSIEYLAFAGKTQKSSGVDDRRLVAIFDKADSKVLFLCLCTIGVDFLFKHPSQLAAWPHQLKESMRYHWSDF
jgi:hypothetical protein